MKKKICLNCRSFYFMTTDGIGLCLHDDDKGVRHNRTACGRFKEGYFAETKASRDESIKMFNENKENIRNGRRIEL